MRTAPLVAVTPAPGRVWHEAPPVRQRWADELLDRLTPFMSALGVLFLLLVLAENFAEPGSRLAVGLLVANWALWLVFVAEFVVRVVVAPDRGRFLRRNWWQVLFLALPFLRLLRLLRSLRLLRAGRVVSSAVRSSRSTRRVLSDRLAWLAVMTSIVVVAASQLVHQFGSYDRYGDALHATALAALAGEPLAEAEGWLAVVEVGLVVFSVVVFATLAGAIGAFLLRQDVASPAGEGRHGTPGP